MAFTATTPLFQARAPATSSAALDVSAAYAEGDTEYNIAVDVSRWAVADSLTLTVEFSPDGGITWGWGATATTTGGPHTLPDRVTPAWPAVGGTLPRSDNPASTGAGWPAVQPAQVLARATMKVPNQKQTQVRVTLT